MYSRVVRFTGVTPEAVANVVAQVESSDGPPPGVSATSMSMIYDSTQGTSLFMASFETEEAMKAADQIMGAMDIGETPGVRVSVDMGEVVIEREA